MQAVTVRQFTLGKGAPKIIVSLMGIDVETIRSQAQYYRESVDFDIVELRIDHFLEAQSQEQAVRAVQVLREVITDNPILFTFRSVNEGGEQEVAAQEYFAIYKAVVDSGLVDLIDLELFMDEALAVELMVDDAHAKGVKVVMSNHDFAKTPPKEEIISRLRQMQDLGADILKIAVMPQSPQDVLVLLDASAEMHQKYATQPIIAISMGELGMVSRLAGSVFGSCATFGAAGKASASGQIEVGLLREILKTLGAAHA